MARRRKKATAEIAVIENCEASFYFVCPRLWDDLEAIADEAVRHCYECSRDVHLARSIDEGQAWAGKGWCVALLRSPGSNLPPVVGGMMYRDPYET